ncbi:hypothetical protein [Hallerella succinigenes]|uniref:hypothetical protein n=1 Tax=Hallerella succinigenes TaxID=1896222 RepID=UPI002A82B5D6|nr:hypothetical protein [Hallerella succinigenes]MDY5028993.1 hypothetical protein [Hallerella succinigenes]
MQKKLMYGLALAAIAGGAFVACGSGDVSGVTSEDKGNVFVYDSSYYVGRVETATNACASDAECAKKANNTVIEESSSSAEITEPGSSSAAVTSSASTEKSSSSAVINFSSASTSSSSTVVSSSSVEIQDDGTVNGTCAPVPATINKGESTTWTFTQVTPAGMAGITAGAKAAYEWTMPKSTERTANGTGLKTTTATYATESGTMTATLVVDGNTIQCSALQVNGAPITGCVCTPDAATVDIAGASATASWKVTGCTSDATITGFAWSTGVTGSDNTGSMTVSAKGDVTPTVTVSNAEGTKQEVTCGTVKVTDSAAPEYEILKANDLVTLPKAGSYTISMGATNPGGCQIWCTSATGESWSASVNGGAATSGTYHAAIEGVSASDCSGTMSLELTGATSEVKCGANWW